VFTKYSLRRYYYFLKGEIEDEKKQEDFGFIDQFDHVYVDGFLFVVAGRGRGLRFTASDFCAG